MLKIVLFNFFMKDQVRNFVVWNPLREGDLSPVISQLWRINGIITLAKTGSAGFAADAADAAAGAGVDNSLRRVFCKVGNEPKPRGFALPNIRD